MGSKNSNTQSNYGNEMKKSSNEFITKTEKKLNSYNPNSLSKSKLVISSSIKNDLNTLKKISEVGKCVKVGVLGRSSFQNKLIYSLYMKQISNGKTNYISSSEIKNSNILNINDLDEQTRDSIKKQMKFYFNNGVSVVSNIKLTKYFPTPSIINENLMLTSSPQLQSLTEMNDEDSGCNIELDIDDVNKFLLFSALHDLLIYVPETNNLDREISYLDFISDNKLILKLLRKNNFFLVLEKSKYTIYPATKEKLNNLIQKLGKTVAFELNYSKAEKDKIKYLGSMIEKKGKTFYGTTPYDEIKLIISKFDTILYDEEYSNYSKEIKKLVDEENQKAEKDPKYKKKTIPKKSFSDFKLEYVNKVSEVFSTSSGIDHIEETLFNSFMTIFNNKVKLLRSSISFKLFLFDKFEEFESNELIMIRNEIVEDMNQSFQYIRDIIKKEENYLIDSCEDLMSKVIQKKKFALEFEGTMLDTFWNIFDISGNFVPFNNLLIIARAEYFKFNKTIFTWLTKVCNLSDKILETLKLNIINKYSNIFREIEKKSHETFIKNYLNSNNFSEPDLDMNMISTIEELIKLKLEKINILSIHLYSIFSMTTFSLEQVYPYYLITSYGGSLTSLILFVSAYCQKSFDEGAPFAFSGGITLAVCMLLSVILKSYYRSESRKNFVLNIDKLINFISFKKDKIVEFPNALQKFYEIYSREALELVDLITGIAAN